MKTKKIKDIMTKKVVTCQQDDNTYEAAVKMRDADIGAIPVVNGDELVGIVTDRDLVLRGFRKKAKLTGSRLADDEGSTDSRRRCNA